MRKELPRVFHTYDNIGPEVLHKHGYTCFNYRHCHNTLETPYDSDGTMRNMRKAENYAGQQGWVIGHLNGQGHIGCPDCASSLHDASPLKSYT